MKLYGALTFIAALLAAAFIMTGPGCSIKKESKENATPQVPSPAAGKHDSSPADCMPAAVDARPKIEIDTPDYNIGTIVESKTSSFSHRFRIKNTGNAPLVISFVRKSCGCTSVAYDSVIQPGGTGSITEEVSTENASDGEFKMPISVTSNAENTPMAKLSIYGIYKKQVLVEPQNFQLFAEKQTDTGMLVTLTTRRKELQVTGVSFLIEGTQSSFNWEAAIPLAYTFAKVASAGQKNDSLSVFKLRIKFPASEKENRMGTFIMATNLPEKPEIRMLGNIVVQ